jgi:acyl-coenzyme A thioesterase PaaI-like protein
MPLDDPVPVDHLPTERLAPHQPWCMGCGPENPATLGLKTWRTGDRIFGEATLRHEHEGAPGYVHGGAVATLLDDVLGFAAMMRGGPVVTARLEVDYRAPVLMGVPLAVEAWEEAPPEGRKRHLRGVVRDGDGRVLAEGKAMFVTVDRSHFHASAGATPREAGELPW